MSRQHTSRKARRDREAGKAASTQAGEFVREEIELIRHGAHGVRSTKQAIAIGLSKARRAGVKLPPPKSGSVPEQTRRQALRDAEAGRNGGVKHVSRKRSRATLDALKRESSAPVSPSALAQQSRRASLRRSAADRSDSAKKAARTRAARQ